MLVQSWHAAPGTLRIEKPKLTVASHIAASAARLHARRPSVRGNAFAVHALRADRRAVDARCPFLAALGVRRPRLAVAECVTAAGARPFARRLGGRIRALLIRANLACGGAIQAFAAEVATRQSGKALLTPPLEVAAARRAAIAVAQSAPERARGVNRHEHAGLIEAHQA
jgi:hypothetical protein